MINHNKIFVLIALGAMAYWCNPVQALESILVLHTEKGPHDIIGPQDNGPQDTSTTGGDTTVGTTSITKVEEKVSVRIYPMPATNYFILETNHPSNTARFILYSLQGKELVEFEAKERVDISTLPRGTYIIRAKDATLGIRSEKVLLH